MPTALPMQARIKPQRLRNASRSVCLLMVSSSKLHNCLSVDAHKEIVKSIPQGLCLSRLFPSIRMEMSVWTGTQKEKHRKAVLFFLAQWEGFEPSDGFWPSHDFQSCSL